MGKLGISSGLSLHCAGIQKYMDNRRHSPWLPTVLYLLSLTMLQAQQTVTWDELAEVEFASQMDEEFGLDVLTATFSPHLISLDSQVVQITGFMIPLNPMGTSYVLSRFPNANCFFCGGAGPETIVELRLKPQYVKRYATDTFATFRGRLQLNERNLTSFNYVLADAEKVE